MARPLRLVLSCEHGGNEVPAPYRGLFAGHGELLASHRGFDPGALPLARALARALDAPLEAARVTRLLVDLNRSAGNRALFSPLSRCLPKAARETLLARHYRPYRRRLEEHVAALVAGGATVLHLSVHTFTPILDGRVRAVEVGLLYDPARGREQEFCRRWQRALAAHLPHLAVRRNAPYRGVSDSLTGALRRAHPEDVYLGLELEVRQDLATCAATRRRLGTALAATLEELVADG